MAAAVVTAMIALTAPAVASAAISATEGSQFSGQLATVRVPCTTVSSAQATITWGDGATSAATVTGTTSPLTVSGSHTYAEEGTYSGSISGSYDCAVAPQTFSASFSAQVADAALSASGVAVTATPGAAFTGTVASFTDADPAGAVSDYTAAIDWGDGSATSPATIAAAPGGGFDVAGSHTYASAGTYTVTVTIADAGGASARASATANVTAPPPPPSGLTLHLAPGATFNGTVGTVTSQCLAAQLTSGAVAAINWGDGQSSAARVLIAGQTLEFAGSHAYRTAGSYQGSVTGVYHCGQQTVAISGVSFGGVIGFTNVVQLRAQGMDVTQGIVNDGNLNPSGVLNGATASFAGLSWSPPDFGHDSLPSATLAADNWTVVRFYADAHGASGAGLAGVGAQLYGYNAANGQPLPGSPLSPDYGPSALPDTGESDPAPVYTAERTSDANAYTFTLPQSWTSARTIKLVGKLIPPPPSGSGLFATVTCSTPGCQANLSYGLGNISFVLLPYVVIAPVAMVRPGEPALPDPFSLYWKALRTEPNATGYIVLPYVATVDPTQVIDSPYTYDPNGDLNSGYLQLLQWWAGWYYFGVPDTERPNIITAVNEDQRGVTVQSIYNYPSPAYDVVNIYRPLTSVAHELGHALGRNHADDSAANGKADGTNSSGCGGGGGPWPPDGLGYMQGIGLDSSAHPYRILYPGLPGEPSQWYDKMSYCVNTDESTAGGNLPDTWTSPYGWLHSISALYVFGKTTGRLVHSVRARAASSGPQLFVSAVSDSSGTKIVSVVPSAPGTPTQPATGGYQLVARDGAGQTVATGSLYAQQVHDDPGPTYTDMIGTVPAAAGIASIAIVHDGSVIASRVRPTQLPHVRVLAPRRGTRVGGARRVVVRWRATDRARVHLVIAVDYSANGGRSWRTVYLGPNRGHVSLPSFYFAGSRDARVRVRASDGFNAVAALSARFTALPAPPQATILSPASGTRIAGDARLQLLGRAFDQRLRRLTGRAMQWRFGRFVLGSGAALSAEPLPPGRDRIQLLARSGAGPAGVAAITVVVKRVPFPFLRLRLPRRLAPGARLLRFHASSTVPGTVLRIDGRRFRLSARPRGFKLRVGRGPLLLQMSVSYDGATSPFAELVQR